MPLFTTQGRFQRNVGQARGSSRGRHCCGELQTGGREDLIDAKGGASRTFRISCPSDWKAGSVCENSHRLR